MREKISRTLGAKLFVLLTVSGLLAYFTFLLAHSAHALIPTTMNFQGRLMDSSGTIKADGLYNMKFAIYTVASGGTAAWTETREVSGTDYRIQLTNGLFSTQLGQRTPLPASLFTNTDLYFEITMANPATATCSTASCQTWEAAMPTRQKLASSAYAFNSDTLDGLDSAAFAQLGSANTFAAATTIQTTNATAFKIQNATGTAYVTADTSTGQFLLGSYNGGTNPLAGKLVLANATNANSITLQTGATTTSYKLVLPTSVGTTGQCLSTTVSGSTSTLGWASCGGGGGGGQTRMVTLVPEYPGGVLKADGSNNTGTMTSDYDTTNRHNYYLWSNSTTSLNDYDIIVRTQIPSEYASGFGSFKLWVYADSNSTLNNDIKVTVRDGAGTACSTATSILPATAATWTQQTVTLSGCTFAANDLVTADVQVLSKSNNAVRVGEMSYTYTN